MHGIDRVKKVPYGQSYGPILVTFIGGWGNVLELIMGKCFTRQLTLIYFLDSDYDRALRCFNVTLIKDPHNADAHGAIGIIYYLQGKYSDAVTKYQEVGWVGRFTLCPLFLMAFIFSLGTAQLKIQQFTFAID